MARKRRADSIGSIGTTTLGAWMSKVKSIHAESSAEERGACLVKDPRTGLSMCIRTSKDACKALKGTYVGGPCG